MPHRCLRHICEVCGIEVILTPTEAFKAGWDYPPKMGTFGAIGPRTCGECGIDQTVWWALMTVHSSAEDLTDQQKAVLARILSEPMSIEVEQ